MAVTPDASISLAPDTLGTDPLAAARTAHAPRKLTAGERIELLLDPDSQTELRAREGQGDEPGGGGVLTVHGTIGGRPVCVFAKDRSVGDGTLSARHAEKISRLQELAIESRIPIIGIFDSAGMRLESGMAAFAGYGAIARNCAAANGLIPQIALVSGECIGADALLASLFDFLFMTRTDSCLYVTGPDIVETVTGEHVDANQLGGWDVHARTSATADGVYDNDVLALSDIRRLVGMLPASADGGSPPWTCLDPAEREAPALDTLVPEAGGAYDVHEALVQISDDCEFFELQADFAANLVIGLARLNGQTVGLVANQSQSLAGVLNDEAARKASRFVRWCDSFGIAIVSLVDTPGFLPGLAQEHAGLARHASELLRAYALATVPVVTVVIRQALGGAGILMGSRALGADLVYSWPGTQIGLIGAQGAAALTGHAAQPDQIQRYTEQTLAPEAVAAGGGIDDIIAPRQTRHYLIRALTLMAQKKPRAGVHRRVSY